MIFENRNIEIYFNLFLYLAAAVVVCGKFSESCVLLKLE